MTLALLAPLLGCTPAAPTSEGPTLGETVQVVPGAGIPAEVDVQAANNNLDVVWHEGELYLAFRTAPSHFASAETELVVVRSADQETWTLEARFAVGSDLREPRFLAWDGRLILYFAVLGEDLFDFEPQGMMGTERTGPGAWTEPAWLYEDGFIPWRARVLDGVPYLIGYTGGAEIYDGGGEVDVHWLTTADGWTFDGVVAGEPVVLSGGSSETDFAFLDDGALVAVSRNEDGDELGWGSKICRAEPGALGAWNCAGDPRKYDSPLVFRHGEDVWLIGRRNLNETGYYDLDLDSLSDAEQTLAYQLDYWQWPKRCSLWRVDPDALLVEWVLDLPSKGDTCFASVAHLGPDRSVVYNYSSPIDGPDVSWLEGQTGETNIYRTVLEW